MACPKVDFSAVHLKESLKAKRSRLFMLEEGLVCCKQTHFSPKVGLALIWSANLGLIRT